VKEILLVEDSDDSAVLTRRALIAVGILNPVRHLTDGCSALTFIQGQAVSSPSFPSVLLLDLKLPGLNGFEILAYLKDKKDFTGMLKIVLSDLHDTKSIRQAYALGANSFLNKPITSADLCNLIDAYPNYWHLQIDQRRAG